ncbi:MAG TPA: GGDEF domain-containing protein [Burkholderiaceae bacterium]|nr:GGDEF domain-containing protein [Burkholderiaceae bacterium]
MTTPLRVQKFRSDDWSGTLLPLAMAGAGVAAAWVDRGPLTWLAVVLLLALCAAASWIGWRRRHAAVEVRRLVAEHRMLRESIENTPMPYAVYDDQDRLIAWNKAYEATHAEAFRRLRSQAEQGRLQYGELLRVTAEATLPAETVADHVAQRLLRQREADGVAVDREYPSLGWLRVCKFATPSGAVAGFAVDINELKQREAALKEQIALSDTLARQLRELANTDALTGTQNRRAFLERAAEELQRARRYGHPLCVAMLDIDAFKAVNDLRGHAAGDQVLARVASVCMAQLRLGADHCGRLGGEEFAILMPETDLAGAEAIAQRLCVAIRELRFEAAGQTYCVSASIGVAVLTPADGDVATLLARADAALYMAKGTGRDRVMVARAGVDALSA